MLELLADKTSRVERKCPQETERLLTERLIVQMTGMHI
jgi:hypothetical protein